MSTLHVLDATGDTTVTWTPSPSKELIADVESAFDTALAVEKFREMKAMGYRSHATMSADDTGNDAVIVHEFPYEAEAVIMVPQTVGG